LYYLLRALDRERYAPAVAVWNYRATDLHVGLLEQLGVPIYSLGETRSRLGKLTALRRLAAQLTPEVIHSYNFYTNFAATWAAAGTNAITFGSVRNAFAWSKQTSGPVAGRLSARWPKHQIYNSVAAAEEVQGARSYFVPKETYVVTNGLDLARFRQTDVPMRDPAEIVGVGYWLPAKRWDRVVRAAATLKERGLRFRIRLVGGGPLGNALQQQIRHAGVVDCVQLVAHTDDVPSLLAEAAFVVHTADNEGCPNAVMEAMACGRAVVATRAGDTPQLIDDGVTGFVVAGDDETMLADRIAELIGQPERCVGMGAAARRKAERDFSIDRLLRQTLQAYRAAGWHDPLGDPESVDHAAAPASGAA